MSATTEFDWLGKQKFARVPESVLLDSRIGPRHFKLLSILILHAGKNGEVWPGLERLAEMLGYFKKDGSPDKQLVSKLISWTHSEKSPGLGLVQLGYIKKGGWIKGRDTQTYQLCIPQSAAKQKNSPTDRKLPDAVYQVQRVAKIEALAEAADIRQAAKRQKSVADVFVYAGDEYDRIELQSAFNAGGLETYPRPVIEYFGYKLD